jgi:poly(beta-D-mannuronate) lyase
MTTSSIITVLLILTLETVAAQAADVFPVTTPKEIDKVLQRAKPGDSIVMKNGRWDKATIRFRGEGEPHNPITLAAETPGKVILTGSSNLRIGGKHLVVDGLLFKDEGPAADRATTFISFRLDSRTVANDCRVTNCAIDGINPNDLKRESHWVSLYGCHNRFDHCALLHKTNLGTTLVVWLDKGSNPQPNYHQIDHNYFGPRPKLGMNGGETIRIGDSSSSMQNSRTTVESNYFYQCSGEAEIISNKSCENVYRCNTFVECGGALTLRHGNRCTVEGNFFFGKGSRFCGGVRIVGEDHKVINNYFADLGGVDYRAALTLMEGIPHSKLNGYFQVKNALIAFNTFVNNKQTFDFGLGVGSRKRSLPPENCIVANNVVLSHHSPLVILHDPVTTVSYIGNIMFGAELGISPTPGIRQLDPTLTKAADGLWRPAADSPAIGSAEGDFADVKLDMDGQQRGGKRDVGADQRSDQPVHRRPLTAKDVGPAWFSR